MIVYQATRSEFTQDVLSNQIEDQVLSAFRRRLGRSTGRAEVASWKNSLVYMNNALMGAAVPHDAGVAIEYTVPQTSKRVDFILTGLDQNDRNTAVIVELKQWSEAFPSEKDAIVETFVGGAIREQLHPSYQAWTYAALIQDFNEAAHDGKINLQPCAYLHNFETDYPLKTEHYSEHTSRAPLFVRSDTEILQAFLKKHIRKGDQSRTLYLIENGQMRPSKGLADHLASLLKGNREFELIDEQKLVYETALEMALKATPSDKQVLIIEGGPGTGKSVISINLLVALTQSQRLVQYVTRNAAPRAVYQAMLAGTMKKTHITNMFKSSGAYVDASPNTFDALIVDEAHRLNEKSGLYGNLGTNQIAEIIGASKFSVFFVDDDQRVTLKDIGEASVIMALALDQDATIQRMSLQSQFRCNGSDGYLAWIDNTLAISSTANTSLEGVDYDFQIFDSPQTMHDRIIEHNTVANKSRMVAGYCWDWKGKRNPLTKDIVIARHDYQARWNLDKDGSLWILMPESVQEVGCIHTCQGLELDYVGVIVGPDLIVRNGVVITDALKRSSQDRSVHGYKKMLKADPQGARFAADRIIKNTYRALMTRGQRGCFVFSVDPETNEYLKDASAGRDGSGSTMLKVAEPDASQEH